jgi:branched-chain amino acid transport system permease protein
MVYGVVQLINFAHGDVIMVGAYVALIFIPLLSMAGLPLWLCIIISALLCAGLGMLIEIIAYRPLRKAPRLCSLITAIGMSLFLKISLCSFFAEFQALSENLRCAAHCHRKHPDRFNTLLTISVSLILMFLLSLFIKSTKIGTAMRAVSEDEGAPSWWRHVNSTISITFAIGSALAAVSAVFYASS